MQFLDNKYEYNTNRIIMNKSFNKETKINKGFTLIELLVVISIIGILTTLVAVNLNAFREKAREVERKSDLSQYRTALEYYANNHDSLYPVVHTPPVKEAAETLCGATFLNMNATSCPIDPLTPDHSYYYLSDLNGTVYLLWVKSETETNKSWVVCSNGVSGYATGDSFGNSSCPL